MLTQACFQIDVENIRGFHNIYPFSVKRSTEDNFRATDNSEIRDDKRLHRELPELFKQLVQLLGFGTAPVR